MENGSIFKIQITFTFFPSATNRPRLLTSGRAGKKFVASSGSGFSDLGPASRNGASALAISELSRGKKESGKGSVPRAFWRFARRGASWQNVTRSDISIFFLMANFLNFLMQLNGRRAQTGVDFEISCKKGVQVGGQYPSP